MREGSRANVARACAADPGLLAATFAQHASSLAMAAQRSRNGSTYARADIRAMVRSGERRISAVASGHHRDLPLTFPTPPSGSTDGSEVKVKARTSGIALSIVFR